MADITTSARIAGRLRPARPHDFGVEEHDPDFEHIAAARVLANEAEDVLMPRGFTEEQLRLWAESYLIAEHSGDLESFLTWVAEREGAQA